MVGSKFKLFLSEKSVELPSADATSISCSHSLLVFEHSRKHSVKKEMLTFFIEPR